MIDKEHFFDCMPRKMIPYKEWEMIHEDGSQKADPMVAQSNGPFSIIWDYPSVGHGHLLFNLLDKETKKLLLDKSIRQIEYYQEGFYLLYDNNEDELEDKRGESHVNDYQSKMNVMFNDGTLLSDKLYLDSWFDRVVPEVDGFYIKCKSRRIERRIDFNGAPRDEGYYLKYNCRILITDDYNYSVIDGLSHKVTGDFTSIMWSDNGLWLVNMLSKGVYRSYFYGQGNEIIYYAHEILIKTGVIALLEKDNIWYSLDLSRNLLPCFKWIHQIEK